MGCTLKSALFGPSSSLPPPVGGGGGLVCELVGKAGLLSDHSDSKQSRESVDLPLTCHQSRSLITLTFRSSEVRCLLLDLDPYGGTDLLGMFHIFLKENCCYGPRLSVAFQRLVCWLVSLLSGDRPMSPHFRMVKLPPLLPITDRFT